MLGEVTGEPARTYSIGFEAQGYDEMAYARIAARHFGTRHHEYYVTPDDVVDRDSADRRGLRPAVRQLVGGARPTTARSCAKDDGVDAAARRRRRRRALRRQRALRQAAPLLALQRSARAAAQGLIEPLAFAGARDRPRWARRSATSATRRCRCPRATTTTTCSSVSGRRRSSPAISWAKSTGSRPLAMMARDLRRAARAATLINRMLALDLQVHAGRQRPAEGHRAPASSPASRSASRCSTTRWSRFPRGSRRGSS